jgi:peptidyl-prolyl cis-trans isomerase SurA
MGHVNTDRDVPSESKRTWSRSPSYGMIPGMFFSGKSFMGWGPRVTALSVIVLIGLGLGTASSSRAELVDGIAAVVNDGIITFTDVKNIMGNTEESLRRVYAPNDPELIQKLREARKEALDQLIERQLIIQQFNQRGGRIPEHLIEEEIKLVIDEQYGRDRSLFIKTLEALGLNLESYKERIRDKIIVRYMHQYEITNEIILSPYKIEKYYKENPEEFREGEMVKLNMLYIRKSGDESALEGARSLAQELLLKLTTGSEFASLAAVYSEGPEKKKGGDLGFVTRDSLREELREPAFSLLPGQYSKVIETSDGFYILQVDEKKPAKVTSAADAREMIERKLIQQERERLQKKWVQSLKRKAYIRLY